MTDTRLLDSSAWLSYLYAENTKIKNIVESEEIILTSALSIFEIKFKLFKDKKEPFEISRSLDFIKRRSLIGPLDTKIAEKAVELSMQHSLPAVDSLIYATSLAKDAIMITLDNDFRGLKDVLLI